MAINNVKFAGTLQAQSRVDIKDINSSPVAVMNENGELILETKSGRISVDELIKRIEALEQAYMEDKLLGKTEEPDTIKK